MADTPCELIVHNGTIVTADEDFRIIDHGALGVRQGRIAWIAPGPLPPAAAAPTVIDAAGGVVMPGLVNTHCHAPMSLFRGLADDLPLAAWLNEHIFPAEARHVTPESVTWGTRLACAEMLLGGITTVCDGYFLEERAAAVFAECGMRAVAGQGVIDFPAPGVPEPARNLAVAGDFLKKWRRRSPLVAPSVFCHAPYTCSAETLRGAKRLAAEAGALFQIHVAETRDEVTDCRQRHGVSPVAYLDRLGVLDADTLLVHCVWLDEADIALIAERGAAVSHNPESNMKLASGIAPLAALTACGIRVGLGTDGCASNNDLDLFGEMGTAARLHKAAAGDPTVLDARQVLRLATREGAAAVGLGEQTGSLEVGKRADLVVLDTRRPHWTPLFRPESHLVYSAGAADVSSVVIDGRLVVDRRRLLTLDLEATLAQARRLAAAIGAGGQRKGAC